MSQKPRKSKPTSDLSRAADALEKISDGFYALDRDWRYTYVNRRSGSVVGLSPEELIGRVIWEQFPELIGSELEAKYRQAMNRGQPQEFEMLGARTNQWFNILVYPSQEGIAVIGHDITERKQAQEALWRSEERLRLAASVPAIVLSEVDLDLRYVWILNQHLGFDSSRIIGKRDEEIGPSEDSKKLTEIKRQALESGSPQRVEWSITLADGKHYYDLHMRPRHNEKGDIVGLTTASIDVTDRKRAEEALARAKEELEIKVKERTKELAETNKQLKQYGRRITQVQEEERKRIAFELHDDTAQYLSILKLEIEALINSGQIESPEVLDKLEYLKNDAERAFNDVRRYSHELRPGVLEHLGLQAAIEQIAEDINKLKQTPVELHIEGSEPDVSEEVKLAFFRIAQEAMNNARKHAVASKVIIDLKFTPRQVCMTISDDGIGFDVRQALLKSGSQGSLGLMSMQERANLVNAELKIESELHQGTRVIIKADL